jgi:hypothetical protein
MRSTKKTYPVRLCSSLWLKVQYTWSTVRYLAASETLVHCVASGDQETIHCGSLYPEHSSLLGTHAVPGSVGDIGPQCSGGNVTVCVCVTMEPLSSVRQLFYINQHHLTIMRSTKKTYPVRLCSSLWLKVHMDYSTVPGGVRDVGPLCGIRRPGNNPLQFSVPRTVLYSVHMQYLVASETLAHSVRVETLLCVCVWQWSLFPLSTSYST